MPYWLSILNFLLMKLTNIYILYVCNVTHPPYLLPDFKDINKTFLSTVWPLLSILYIFSFLLVLLCVATKDFLFWTSLVVVYTVNTEEETALSRWNMKLRLLYQSLAPSPQGKKEVL